MGDLPAAGQGAVSDRPTRGRTAPREIEWHFDVVDLRPVERWLDGHVSDLQVGVPGRKSEQNDVYADTDDWRLHRAGFSLRIRSRSGSIEATLKSRADVVGALQTRTDLSVPVPTSELTAIDDLDHPLGQTVRTIIGKHQLRPVVEIRTLRKMFTLSLGGARVGELTLDATTIPIEPGQEPARLQRVEVEVRNEGIGTVRPFVESLREACGLMPASMSKMEVGLLAVGRSPSGVLDFGPTEVLAGLSTGEVAFAVLREQFRIVLQKEGGTRLRQDPEELHDMRVATRRLRAALALFSEALPARAGRFRDEFKWVAEGLGRVRDLDVQLSDLDRWETGLPTLDRRAFSVLRRLLAADRRSAEADLISRLDSVRYERLVASFSAMLRRGPLRRSAASRVPILVSAPPIVSRRYRKVRRAGAALEPASGPEDYHRLRIVTKRLRYALEFVAPIYGSRAKKLIKQLAVVQDLLGEHQDAQVAIDRLRSLVDRLDEPPLPTIFAMGRVAERYASRAIELRNSFPEVFGSVRPRWRKFRSQMETRREALGWRPPRTTLRSQSGVSRGESPTIKVAEEGEAESVSLT